MMPMSLRDALPRWPLDGGFKSEGIGWDPLRRFVSCTLRIHRPPAGRRCVVTTLSHLWQFASACCSAPSSTVRSPLYGSTRRRLPETLSTAHFSICCAPWITHRWRQWAFCGSSEPPSCPSVQANCHFDWFRWRPAWRRWCSSPCLRSGSCRASPQPSPCGSLRRPSQWSFSPRI